jgi:hypothetical protein
MTQIRRSIKNETPSDKNVCEPTEIRLAVHVDPTTLPIFGDGSPQEAAEFLRKFKQWMIPMKSLDNEMKAEYFASCFSAFSPAEQFYNTLPESIQCDYATLVKDFQTEFIEFAGPKSPTKAFMRFCDSKLDDGHVGRTSASGRVMHTYFADHMRSLLPDLDFVPEDVKCLILRRNCGFYTRQMITADVKQPMSTAAILTYISELKSQDLREFIRDKEQRKDTRKAMDDIDELALERLAASSIHLGECLHGFSQLSMRSSI